MSAIKCKFKNEVTANFITGLLRDPEEIVWVL
jgi:hypothetical protein